MAQPPTLMWSMWAWGMTSGDESGEGHRGNWLCLELPRSFSGHSCWPGVLTHPSEVRGQEGQVLTSVTS